jgi:hypothetical protein
MTSVAGPVSINKNRGCLRDRRLAGGLDDPRRVADDDQGCL